MQWLKFLVRAILWLVAGLLVALVLGAGLLWLLLPHTSSAGSPPTGQGIIGFIPGVIGFIYTLIADFIISAVLGALPLIGGAALVLALVLCWALSQQKPVPVSASETNPKKLPAPSEPEDLSC